MLQTLPSQEVLMSRAGKKAVEGEVKVSFSAFAIIFDAEGKNLLAFLDTNTRSRFTHGRFKFPGGGLKKGETFAAAAIREVREETGLQVEIISPCVQVSCVKVHDKYDRETVREEQYKVFFLCRVMGGAIRPDHGKGYERLGYWPPARLECKGTCLIDWHREAMKWALRKADGSSSDAADGIHNGLMPEDILSRPGLIRRFYRMYANRKKYRG